MKPKVYELNQRNDSSPASMNTMKEADVTRLIERKTAQVITRDFILKF
jgi:hypothetical protein